MLRCAGIVAAALMMTSGTFLAQSSPPQGAPPLDFSDQLYLFAKQQTRDLQALKEQIITMQHQEQATAAWWQQVWDGLKKE